MPRQETGAVGMEFSSTSLIYRRTSILWEFGGANAQVLADCPTMERLKFSVLAVLHVLLAGLASIVAWSITGPFLERLGILDRYLVVTVLLSVLAFVVTLSLLISAVRGPRDRIASRSRHAGDGFSASAWRAAMLLRPLWSLGMGSTIGLFVGAALPLLSERARQSSVDNPFLIFLPVLVFVAPSIIARLWSTPVYDYLVDGYEPGVPVASTPTTPQFSLPSEPSELQSKERELRRLFGEHPDSMQLGTQLIAVQRRLHRFDDALTVYDTLIEAHPRNAELIRAKGGLYREMGDEDRYRKTQEEADRLEVALSFEVNVGKAITVRRFWASDIEFFSDFDWPMQPGVNILLGRNGYGKTYLLRALVALLQNDEQMTRPFVEKSRSRGRLQMAVDREGTMVEATRSKLLLESGFGKVPVLAIPDMRYVDKSKVTVGSSSDEIADLKSQGAVNFLREESYQGLITSFLYGLCIDQLDPKHRPDTTLIQLVERSVASLSGSKFKFHDFVRKDNARFEILILTEGSSEPLPIQKASQGTLSVVAMLGLIYRYLQSLYPGVPAAEIMQQRAIVVIDEIDAHLHPSWQQKILRLFRSTFPNVQFIVTAHSPLVVAGARGGEVAVLAPSEGRFKVEVLTRHFIGATFDELYTAIFGVERVDATFKSLGTLIANKSDLEERARRLEDKSQRTSEEDDVLSDLREQLYYLKEYETQQAAMDRRTRLESEKDALVRRNKELEAQLVNLKAEASGANVIPGVVGAPTEMTREFFKDLLGQGPANVQILARYLDAIIDDGWLAVARAALDAMEQEGTHDVHVLKRMAVAYERLELFSHARDALQRAANGYPKASDFQASLERLKKLS